MKEKPVFDVNTTTMWNYEYQAKLLDGAILASNSLINLKAEIRNNTKCTLAWITTRDGALSYGQNVVDEYPYMPQRAAKGIL